MSSMGVTAVWTPVVPEVRASVRLTRRGRLIRGLALAVLVLVALAVSLGRLVGEPVRASSEPVAPVVTQAVVVEQGDSLWAIAQRVAPTRDPREVVLDIRELNGLRSNLIQPGDSLLVPSGI